MTEKSAWEIAVQQFNIAADKLGLDDGTRQVLSHCKRELTVNFPVKMSGDVVKVFTGYRVHHNVARGPAKGGIRYHQDVTPIGEGPGHVDDLEMRGRGNPMAVERAALLTRSPEAA